MTARHKLRHQTLEPNSINIQSTVVQPTLFITEFELNHMLQKLMGNHSVKRIKSNMHNVNVAIRVYLPHTVGLLSSCINWVGWGLVCWVCIILFDLREVEDYIHIEFLT